MTVDNHPVLFTRLRSLIPGSLSQRLRGTPSRTVLAFSLLLLLTLLYFWPFLFRGEVIAPTDLLLRYAPWSSQAPEGFSVKNVLRTDVLDVVLPQLNQYRGAISQGDFPLWTPLLSQGRPFASQLLNSFFHPLTAVLLLFPLAQGFSLMVMAKHFLSGLFMYLFLRRLAVGHAGSLLGGVSYMFSGFNIVWLMFPHTLVSSFAPLLFLQTENLLRKPTLGNSALLSLVIAVMVLGGFPAIAGYFFYAVGLYFIVRLAQIALTDQQGWRFLWILGAFCLSFALATGLTAFQLLPTLEHADFVDIDQQRSGRSLVSVPIRHAIQLVFPNFYEGNPILGGIPVGGQNFNEITGYVGIVTLIIAFFGFFVGVRQRIVPAAFFGVLALLSFLIIYDDTGPLRSLVSHLPIFDLNPNTRTLSVFGFGIAGAAAFGFDELLRVRLRGLRRLVLPLALAGSAALMAVLLVFLTREMTGTRALLTDLLDDLPFMDLQALILLDFESFRLATIAFGVVLLALFAILLALHFLRALPPAVVAAAVLVLVITDLFVFAYRQNPTVPNEYFYPQTPGIEFLQANLRPYERMAPFDFTFMIPGTQAFYGLNSAFSHTFYSIRHRQLILAFSGGFVSDTVLTPGSPGTRFDSPIIDLLGIKYLTFQPNFHLYEDYPGSLTKYNLVYTDPRELSIYENKDFEPAFVAGNVKLAAPSQILQELSSSHFNPHSLAYIEEPAPPEWMAAPSAPSDSIPSVAVTHYASDSVTYQVETGSKALLVTPELFYPGWTAHVDGERTEIYRTNYIFRGVFVSAGHHRVTFMYSPASFRSGAIISSLSMGVILAILSVDWAWRFRRSRRNSASQSTLTGDP